MQRDICSCPDPGCCRCTPGWRGVLAPAPGGGPPELQDRRAVTPLRAGWGGGAKLVNPQQSQEQVLTGQEEQTLYSPADIKKFLQGTKGTRLLKVEDHFSDLKLFIESAKPLTKTSGDVGESVLTEQEIYHLKN
ncbi:hypothetical protein L3Q82_026894 [Scortum barcoo]|uniref:Uncharacterized protein n=1 Tax=Scortum barcoo TaxID=214431 RepID=A0ACB8WKH5_9TELE|nr:hypothetical protein L3Q82_026894 [Scortum barcoo]